MYKVASLRDLHWVGTHTLRHMVKVLVCWITYRFESYLASTVSDVTIRKDLWQHANTHQQCTHECEKLGHMYSRKALRIPQAVVVEIGTTCRVCGANP